MIYNIDNKHYYVYFRGGVNCVDCTLKPVSSGCGVEAARHRLHKLHIRLMKLIFESDRLLHIR